MAEAIATKERTARKAKADSIKHQMNGMKLLGEVITFNARSETTHKHKDVIQALFDAGLDQGVARAMLPRQAFTRACKVLSDQAIIDVVKDGQETIKFQFTKKTMKNEEWQYSKETMLELNKTTGIIECKKKELQVVAQRLLDEATEARTTSDITRIVQKLFEKNADLFALRDQGGVYFVPYEHTAFIAKVDKFLSKLGGNVGRFPVPAGTTNGDKAVKEAIADSFQRMIQEHEDAVLDFTVVTRKDTMENAAKKIKETRVKIEAYADYLKDKADSLLKVCDMAKKNLAHHIEKLDQQRESAPKGPDNLFGHAVTKILRWMGANDWDFDEAKKVIVEQHGFVVQDTTIRGQLWVGSSGREKWGKPAELTPAQIKELEKARKM